MIAPNYNTTLYKAADRAFYGQPVINGNVPRLDTLTRVKTFLSQIITGDISRVAAGGAAMTNPSGADVALLNSTLLGKIAIANSGDNAYIDQLLVVAGLNVTVDKLIAVMMAESDLFYVDTADTTKRTYLKLWGYKYYSIGSGSDITFKVLDSVSLLPINLAEARIDANGDSGISSADGTIQLHTTIVDAAIVNFTAALYNDLAFPITIVDKSVTSYTIYLVKVLPTP